MNAPVYSREKFTHNLIGTTRKAEIADPATASDIYVEITQLS